MSKPDQPDANHLSIQVNEIYISLQGESSWAGQRCIFIRLKGCPLRCHYCDTEYAFYEGSKMSFDAVIAEVNRLSTLTASPCRLVELTGGEPLLQKTAPALMSALCDLGYEVLIETAGSEDISRCDDRVIRIMDLKTPGSGEVDRNDLNNLKHLTQRDEIKFVLTSREDYQWMKQMINEHDLCEKAGRILVSSVHEVPKGQYIQGCSGLPAKTVAEWILEDGLDVTFQTQLHKVIWAADKRGV